MQKSVLWGKKIPQISSKFLGTQPPDEGNAKLHGGWRCLPPPRPPNSAFGHFGVSPRGAVCAECASRPGTRTLRGRGAPGSGVAFQPSSPPPPAVCPDLFRADRPPLSRVFLPLKGKVRLRPARASREGAVQRVGGEKRPRKAGDCAQASGLSDPAAGRPNSQGSRHLSAPGRLVLSLFVCLFCYV